MRIVAVLGKNRQAVLPDVPTFSELGLSGFEDVPYYGIFAPANTPRAVIEKMEQAMAKVLALPEVKDKLVAMGLSVEFMTAQQLGSREQAYTKVWSKIIKDSGFQAQ